MTDLPERLRLLNEQIRVEQDSKKLVELTNELIRLLEENTPKDKKPAEMPVERD